ncbi:M48 family metalloprotease [Cupriavidus malaysiensis]|uniref:M48 family metalloprotease n=1 Tax=Cupriavidus malaysiensis TaxID=367825 RepID=UPI000ACBA0B4|nr:M48 family metalloprotease [Cupriavidus malaysiensis]
MRAGKNLARHGRMARMARMRGWTRLLRATALAAAAALLASACATLPGGDSFVVTTGELPPVPTGRTWPDAAQDVRNQRARGNGLVEMPEMQAYLNGLLAKVKTAAGVPNWPGAVYITASNDLEAYCTGAGNIYLSLGWLSSAESEDEIVAILSHEYGHVYLDYHQLEGASNTADKMALWASVGMVLAQKAGNATGWGIGDSMVASYLLGKGVLVPAWGRQQEENADRFGATVSLRLGYSFTQGFKAFLERQDTWEQQNAARREAQKQRVLEQVKLAAADNARKKSAAQGNDAVNHAMREMQASLESGTAGLFQSVDSGVRDLWGQFTESHPSTSARLDSLTAQVMPLMAGRPRPRPSVEPWTRALAQKRSAATLKNYQLAADAQGALQAQDFVRARKLALDAASGPTARQALPLLTLSLAEIGPGGNGMQMQRAAMVLDRNLQSEPDRAWTVYVTRANGLLGSGQGRAAQTVMDQGFTYFNDAPAAWPDAIRFYGQAGDWNRAKQLAAQCASRFPTYANGCNTAALTPAEKAEQERRNEQKAKSLVDRLTKK